MKKHYLTAAVGIGLLLGLAIPADAKGRKDQTAGTTFTPPGFSKGQGKSHWGTTSTLNNGGVPTVVNTPPGWQSKTGNPSWNTTLGGPLPPGLSSCPPGLLGC